MPKLKIAIIGQSMFGKDARETGETINRNSVGPRAL